MADAAVELGTLGPAMTRAMAGDGVDLADQAAVDAWVDDFTALPPDERQQILVRAQSPLPPMHLPGMPALTRAALATPVLRQLAAFVDWAADGQPLTQLGDLQLTDGRHLVAVLGTGDRVEQTIAGRTFTASRSADLAGVDLVFRLARKAWLARRHRGAVVRTDRGARLVGLMADPGDGHRVLDIWMHVVLAMHDLGVVDAGRHDPSGARWWIGVVERMVLDLLAALAMQGRAVPVEAAELAVHQRVVASEHITSADDLRRTMLPETVSRGAQELVDRLSWLGLIRLEGVTVRTDRWGGERRVGGQVALAPLGQWFMRLVLLDHGYDVPLVGDHSDAPVDVLLDAIAGWAPEAFAAQVRSWAQGRPAAADELAMAALDAATPDRRSVVFDALDVLGPAAEMAVRALMASAELRPFAVLWLIEHNLEPPEFFDPADAPSGLVQMLAAVLINEGAGAVCDTKVARDAGETNLSLIEELWRVDDPHTAGVLEALGASPVRKVAQAARRSLFKYRNLNRG